MTSVNSSMLSGLMSTILNDWSVRSMFLQHRRKKANGKTQETNKQTNNKEEQRGVRDFVYRDSFCQGVGFQFLLPHVDA